MPHTSAPLTGNDLFFDAVLSHVIGLRRVEAGIRNRIIALLDATENELRGEILKRLDVFPSGTARTTFSAVELKRLSSLSDAIATIRGTAHVQAFAEWREQFLDIAKSEPIFTGLALQDTMPVVINFALPPVDTLRALVSAAPFRGKVLRQWSSQLRSNDLARINNEIRQGLVQGQSNPDIARRIFGLRTDRGVSGVTEITRREAAAITRTAVTHYTNAARALFSEANTDIIKNEIYTATLDGRTTPICISLDGKVFEVGKGERPPMHFQCRSVRLPVVDRQLVGNRPAAPVTEKQLLREFSASEGIKAPRFRKDLSHGSRGRFDKFARGRKRELIGTVPARTTYPEFLRRQSVEFQNEVLGVKKAQLFRSGELTVRQFVDKKGATLNLSQLKAKHPDAFAA